MPLDYSKSKKAFRSNVGKEMAAGKSAKQAVAIAYNVKRHAGTKMGKHDVHHPRKSSHAGDK